MVEFDDGGAVERACRYLDKQKIHDFARNLNQTKVFGNRLRLEPSRKERVEDIR